MPFLRSLAKMKSKQPHPVYELRSPISIPILITISLSVSLLYNCGRIFFYIIIFHWLYIGLVRLRTIWLSACAGAHIECRCSHSRGDDVTITDVIIKTPDRKWTGDVNDVIPGNDGLRILGDFWKKAVSWDSDSEPGSPEELRSEPRRVQLGLRGAHAFVGSASWDLTLDEAGWDSDLGEVSPVCVLRDVPHVVWSDRTVSIVKIVSLSPRVEKPKSQKRTL